MAKLIASAFIDRIAAAFLQWGRPPAWHYKFQRFSFICFGILISILLMEIAVGSVIVPKAFDPALGAASLSACVCVLLLVAFAIRRAAAVWPIALLQITIILVVGGPATVLIDHVAARCFFIVMTAITLANGLAKLAANSDRFREGGTER